MPHEISFKIQNKYHFECLCKYLCASPLWEINSLSLAALGIKLFPGLVYPSVSLSYFLEKKPPKTRRYICTCVRARTHTHIHSRFHFSRSVVVQIRMLSLSVVCLYQLYFSLSWATILNKKEKEKRKRSFPNLSWKRSCYNSWKCTDISVSRYLVKRKQ